MKAILVCALFAIAFLVGSHHSAAEILAGKFSCEDKGNGYHAKAVELQIIPKPDGRFAVQFQAHFTSGRGAVAPEVESEGKIGSDGVLRFLFADGWGNRGKGAFQKTERSRYRLRIVIAGVREPQCLIFYGEHVLRRDPPLAHLN